MTQLPDLRHLSHAEKDALILALWAQVQAHTAGEPEARPSDPPKTPDNSSTPPSKGQKPNRPEKATRTGPRLGSLGRKGGGRPLACEPDETVTAKAVCCAFCQAALTDADQILHGRHDQIDLPVVKPVITRVEQYAGRCRSCGGITVAPVPEGMEDGSPFSLNILGLAVVFAILGIAANTMMMAMRERTTEFGVLKTLGFTDGAVFGMVLAEAAIITMGGGILGALLAKAVVSGASTGFLPPLTIYWSSVFLGIGIATLIGAVSGLIPAFQASRLRIVDALRRVD